VPPIGLPLVDILGFITQFRINRLSASITNNLGIMPS